MTNTYISNGVINLNNAQTFQNNVTVNGYTITGYDYFSPTSGDTVTITHSYTYINGSGTIAALTLALPASPAPGQQICINADQIVTTLTVTGGTLATAVTALAINTPVRLMFESNTAKWVLR